MKQIVAFAIFIAVPIIGLPNQSHAQMTIAPDFAMAAAMRQARDANSQSSQPRATAGVGNALRSAPITQIGSPESLIYAPSLSRRRTNLARFVESQRTVNPAGAAQMEQMLASTDIFEQMKAPMGAVGLRIDNIADAYTIWWITAWQATNGDYSEPSQAQSLAVKAQVAQKFRATPAVYMSPDSEKQELAEILLLQAAMIGAATDSYKNDPETMRKITDSVRVIASSIGVDLRATRLTQTGFVPAN